jgi:hypothetical protein
MPWTQVTDDPDRARWERGDGYAEVSVRRTADGRWAVALDRLKQAPDGPGYRRETLDEEADARDLAAAWRRGNEQPTEGDG